MHCMIVYVLFSPSVFRTALFFPQTTHFRVGFSVIRRETFFAAGRQASDVSWLYTYRRLFHVNFAPMKVDASFWYPGRECLVS